MLAERGEDKSLSAAIWAKVAKAFREHYGIRRLDAGLAASMLIWTVATEEGRAAYVRALIAVARGDK